MQKPVQNTAKNALQKSAEKKKIQKELELKLQQENQLIKILALIVAVAGFIIYANTLNHGYALDDYSLILENASTRKGFSGLAEIFKSSYRYGYIFVSDEMYRPLSKAMFAIEWQLAPNNAALGHWVNVLLYCLTGYLLTITLFKYFKSAGLAFISALLFIAHPIHTEVVANIKSRDEILALLFSILALLTLKLYTERKKTIHIIFTGVFYFLALLSKESAITFIGVFGIILIFFADGKLKEFIKPLIGISIATLLFFAIRTSIVGNVISMQPSAADNLLMSAPDAAHRLATAIYIAGLYVKLLFFPDALAFDYSYNQIQIIGFNDWRFLVSFIVLLFSGVMALVKIKSRQAWIFGILFFFITFSISSNILVIIGTNMAERLMYAPSLGICIFIAYWAGKLSKTDNSVKQLKQFFIDNSRSMGLTAVIVLLFSWRTIARNPVWKNNFTLYTNDVLVSPNSTRTHYYLGNLLNKPDYLEGKSAAEKDSIAKVAVTELRKSLAIYPPFTDAWNQLGVLYNRMKNPGEAMKCYEEALKYSPNDPTVHNNIGTLLFETGNYSEAARAFQKAVDINPNYVDGYNNLGSAKGLQKQYDKAIEAFQQALRIDPANVTAIHYLGMTYQLMGNNGMANQYFEKEKSLKSN